MGSLIGFVDSGYLKAEGARALSSGDAGGRVRLDAGRVVEWIRDLASSELIDEPFLRCYWYDGAFDANDQRSVSQRRYFDAIASTPGLSLRLGHLVERQDRHRAGIERALERFGIDPVEFSRVHDYRRPEVTQKGVETLMVTDLLSAAFRSQMSTAVVMAGDRDLAEALRVSRNRGRAWSWQCPIRCRWPPRYVTWPTSWSRSAAARWRRCSSSSGRPPTRVEPGPGSGCKRDPDWPSSGASLCDS
jgi:uncharacterized LabA/DUF88 family protein